MKREIEITGILRVVEKETWNVVDLFSNDVKLGEFVFNPKHKSINVELSKCMGKILGINVTEYLDYMKLIEELGLEIPGKYQEHWAPTLKDGTLWCYFVNSVGEIEGNWLSNSTFNYKLVANFNMFPTRGLAEKGKNLSKLGRLILLWQYANDCIFEPDWKDGDTKKYFIRYDYIKEEVCHDYNVTIPSDTLYFETAEQVKTFIEMYETEIKKIMGVL